MAAAAALLLLLVALGAGAGGGAALAGRLGPAGPGPGRASPAETDVAAGCPLPASMVGLCGTVAGSRGWYGSWTTAGEVGAYCLDHAGSEPSPSLAYDKHAASRGQVAVQPEAAARLGYLLSRYGGTHDAVRAAALAVLAHAAVGDTLRTDELTTVRSDLDPRVRDSAVHLWSEAGELHGPYRVTVSFDGPGEGLLHVASAGGAGVPGLDVSWPGSTVVTTDADGRTDGGGNARLRFAAGAPADAQLLVGLVRGLPAVDFAVWRPRDRRVQTVAVGLPPGERSVRTERPVLAPPPAGVADVVVVKSTDNPWVSPAGAAFHLVGEGGVPTALVTTGPDGRTPALAGLAPGNWTLVEDTPCRDCLRSGDSPVVLLPGHMELPVRDSTARHQLTLRKKAPDGTPLAGAVLRVRAAVRPGAGYDVDLGTCSTGGDGACTVAPLGLPSGQYQVSEDQPAPGTVSADEPVREVVLDAADAEVVLIDRRTTTVSFTKTADAPGSAVDPAHVVVAGTVLVVTDPSGTEVGRCTTGGRGGCSLPPGVLVEGRAYGWRERDAPPGLLPAAGSHPFTAAWPAATVGVADAGRWVRVELVKSEVGHADVAVPGAVVDLCAVGLAPELAETWSAPAATACANGETWVGTTTTDVAGRGGFGLVPPGVRYCARERTAPAGWELERAPVCTDVAAPSAEPGPDPGAGLPPLRVELVLAERRVPPPPAATSIPTPRSVPSTRVLAVPPATRSVPPPSRPRRAPLLGPDVQARPPSLPFTGASMVVPLSLLGVGLLAAGLLARAFGGRRSTVATRTPASMTAAAATAPTTGWTPVTGCAPTQPS